jgi:hypothetical protein
MTSRTLRLDESYCWKEGRKISVLKFVEKHDLEHHDEYGTLAFSTILRRYNVMIVDLGGVVVSVLATGPKVRGFDF